MCKSNFKHPFVKLILTILIIDSVRAEETEAPTTVSITTTTTLEPEIGCPPPDFKISRPRKYYPTTEQPFITFETTQIYLPHNFTIADLEFIDSKDHQESGNHESDENSKVTSGITGAAAGGGSADINPFWLDDDDNEGDDSQGHNNNNHNNNRNMNDNKKSRRNSNKHRRNRKNHDKHTNVKREVRLSPNTNSANEEENEEFDEIISTDVFSNILNDNDTHLIQLTNVETILNMTNVATNSLNSNSNNNATGRSRKRVKRKSGKTTGALSRPKGASDSGSKSISRNSKQGQYDEDGSYVPPLPDSGEHDIDEHGKEHGSEEVEESPEVSQFREVHEVRFQGEVGPLGGHRLCKIKCEHGRWIGPLCAINEQEEGGQLKFEPLYKRCVVDQIPPHLQLSYKNVSVTIGWDLPHGHTLQARCQDLGLFKLLGESKVLCSNGLWAPKMPSCVPTTLLTNYSDDSPPSIRIKVGVGSAAYEPSGVLAVLPGSTLHLDCMYPRRRGSPEWTWTGWFRQYLTGWSAVPEEKASRYRLTIKDIQNQDSGTYTCASPRGLTNSIILVVAVSTCSIINEPNAPLSLRFEGNKLGQRALYRCPLGYILQGTANATCLASGNWSAPPPTCYPIQCPPLFLEDPHLSLVELNTSAWGRAVFRCSWGYRLGSAPGLECEPNGRWSGSVPRCRPIQCPQPLIPINGRIDGASGLTTFGQRRYAVGALVTFSCTEGHLLVGEASIVCTETGFWSHPPPFCKAQCQYPGDPPNGLIAPLKFYYDPGDYLTVQCRPGFVEYGVNGGPPERPRCLPDGNWSPQAVPQCRNYEEI